MTLLKWLLIALVGYGGLLGLMYVAQRGLMYFPETARTAPAAAGVPRAEELTLDTPDGEKVIVWHVPPRGDQPVVLYFHGNGGSLRLRANRFRRLTDDGTGLLALSYRGYGGSSGSPSETGFIADAVAVYDYARKTYPNNPLVLWGESLGSGVAAAVAADRPVARVLLESPFISAADIGAAAYPFIPVRLLIKDPFRSDLRVPKITAPVLVLHGEHDRVVPLAHGEKIYEMIQAPKKFVRLARADHNDHDEHGGLEAVKPFIAGNLN